MKPYQTYKDSGLPSLGKIPTHWKLCRNKFLFREVNDRSKKGEETHLSMSQKYGLVESSTIDEWRLQSESYIGAKLCEIGDLVLNRLKAHLGVFARAKQFGVISPDYTVLRPTDEVIVRYFEMLFKTPAYISEFTKATKGIVEGFWRLYTPDFNNIRAIVPPLEEQDAILAFADHNDEQIDRFINNKQKLVTLLNEQKAAIINRAVTRGINPEVRLKASGIDWLGDVPVHWQVTMMQSRALAGLSVAGILGFQASLTTSR